MADSATKTKFYQKKTFWGIFLTTVIASVTAVYQTPGILGFIHAAEIIGGALGIYGGTEVVRSIAANTLPK